MNSESQEVLESNVAKSVKTADEVLAHLEKSFQRGGFESGLQAYRKMTQTLLNQRLWDRSNACSEELDELFRNLAERARRLYGVLGPYAELMRNLGAIDTLQSNSDGLDSTHAKPSSKETPAEHDDKDAVLAALRQKEMSFTALRAHLRCSRDELTSRLNKLERDAKIVSRTSSGRKLFSLV